MLVRSLIAKNLFSVCIVSAFLYLPLNTEAQMRQIYLDNDENNEINKLSFYSAQEGYVAFEKWIGYTTDSGRTFTRKYVTLSNVDYNGNSVNLTFGFIIKGVKAFNQNTVLVYGHYGLVPSILYSTNGGNSYTLVYHSQFHPFELKSGITDMVFPEDNSTGYAADADRILKTINGGITWTVSSINISSYFTYLESVDNNTVFALCTSYSSNKLLKTINGGATWQNISLPVLTGGKMLYAHFLSSTTGWVSMTGDNNADNIYKTIDGGITWALVNDPEATAFSGVKVKFVDANTGYCLSGQNTVYKTTNGGASWEPLERNNNYSYLGYTHNDLQIYNQNQLWAGGGHGFLELSNNSGGTPMPKAYFKADTTNVYSTNIVNLLNYSNPAYTHQWIVNNVVQSTSYNSSYTHLPFHLRDTVTLIVSNGNKSDTNTKYLYFSPPVIIRSFTPAVAGAGAAVIIKGLNFSGTTSVTFGNTPAASFTVLTDTSIQAIVGQGSSGAVKVARTDAIGSLNGFIFVQPPTITSFSPNIAAAGTPVIISGTNFTNAISVSFGNVPASFIVVNATTISATAPSGNSGDLRVTTPGGTATLPGFIALPTISSFTPLQGTIGTVITITGTSLTNTTAVTVGGVNVLSYTINNANSITAIVGGGASGPVNVTLAGGSASKPGFTWFPAPVIQSFLPGSGPVGTVVTITGTGFSTIPTSNTVLFGSVKATVTAASSTSLTVIVPAGATYEPISVTANNLIGTSKLPFLVTFANGGSITASSFAAFHVINTGSTIYPYDVFTGDIDKDGKNDAIVLQNSTNAALNGALIFRNITTGETPSFASPYPLSGSYDAIGIGDLDGDGKEDIVLSGAGLRLYRNISTAGNIAFDTAVNITTTSPPEWFCVTDVDGDGKKDILTRTWPGSFALLLKNISEPGVFGFKSPINIGDFGASRNVIATDLTGDGKPEIIFSSGTILPNNSTPGLVSFGSPVNVGSYLHSFIAAGDADGDGKNDLFFGDRYQSKIHVLKNISNGGNISFANSVDVSATSEPSGICISDMDGDGKADITALLTDHQVCVIKNTTSSGNISFATKIGYRPQAFNADYSFATADFNNDGKNDIIAGSWSENAFVVFMNKVKKDPFILSFDPQMGEAGTVVTIKGYNFLGTASVLFGGAPATSFTVQNDSTITATIGTGATGDITVTNSVGTALAGTFTFGSPPIISSLSSITGMVNSTITINGDNFSSTADNNKVYFGSINAKVLSASSNAISVLVPFGSEGKPVSVTSKTFTTHSRSSFITRFAAQQHEFTPYTFAIRTELLGLSTYGKLGDMDGDGKIDIISPVETYTNNTTYYWTGIARNTSTTGSIKFAPTINFAANSAGVIATGDLDGDGKQDIATINTNLVSIYRNRSTPGALSFEPKVDFVTTGSSPGPFDLGIKDLNGDGKPDIAVAHYSGSTIGVLKNKSNPGNLSFGDRVDYAPGSSGSYFTKVFLEDIDGDNMPEMITTTVSSLNSFLVFRNTSNTAGISFTSSIQFGSSPGVIQVGDIDMDGKIDIVFSKIDTLSVFRNISTPGNIIFAPKADFVTSSRKNFQQLSINDLDGDGKPEIVGSNFDSASISVFKNNSVPGTISLATKINYTVGQSPTNIICADADNDGKTDIFSFNNGGSGSKLSVLRNKNGVNNISIASFAPVNAIQGMPVIIHGSGFNQVTAVIFGNSSADSFIIHSNNLITAYPGTGSSGSVIVSNGEGMASLTGFSYSNKPALTNITPELAAAGATVVLTGANLTNVTAVSFGGVPAASFTINSSTSISAVIASGSVSGIVKILAGADSAILTGLTIKNAPVIHSFFPMNGAGGSTIQIKGRNFTNTISVDFGGINARTITVVRDDSLVVTIPEVNTGDITVTTDAGTASLGKFINVNAGAIKSFYPTVATRGMEVLITGTNMGAVNSVSFGGTPAASFTVTSPTSIVAIVDTGSSGNVNVTIAPGRSSNLGGFTYVAPNQPAIASFAPARAGTGIAVSISGLNFTNVTAVRFGGIPASSFTVVSPQLIRAIVSSTASSGDISIATSTGNAVKNGFVFITAPYISSFTPKNAVPGATVIINGTNFIPNTSANTVYFGAVKATVISATSNRLVVTVPKFATYSKIAVTNNNLTGYSNQKFMPMFEAAGTLNANSFVTRIDSGIFRPTQITVADLDIDGKADLSLSTIDISYIKNQSANGNLSLSPVVLIDGTPGAFKNICTDFNGDGLLDICNTNGADMNGIYVAKNTSTSGNFSVASGFELNPGLTNGSIVSEDIDGDGKPDLAACSFYSGPSVFRNTSNTSTISFAAPVFYTVPQYPSSVVLEDVDGDSKPDMLFYTATSIHILRNNSSVNNISFEPISSFIIDGYCSGFSIDDINKDGYPEIIAKSRDLDHLVIYENKCQPGFLYFKVMKKLHINNNSSLPVVQDIDGDEKPDIISSSSETATIKLFRNNTSNSNLSFAEPLILTPLAVSGIPVIADIDGDNRPEIIDCQPSLNVVSFFKNNVAAAPQANIICGGANTSFTSNLSGTDYQWQVNAGNGFVNIISGGNYSGSTTATLQLTNLPTTWYGNVYRCRIGNKLSNEFTIKFLNKWTGAVNTLWNNPGNWSCNAVPDENTDVSISAGTVLLNTNGICRTLMVSTGASFTMAPGVQLTITH